MNPTHNPWKVLSEKLIYENPWIELKEFGVINPSGGNGIYGKVHFKNLAIGIVALDEEMNTYLVGQYRFVLDTYSWEIPEGGGVIGVDPLESAKRELIEETGLKAESWSVLLNLHLSNSVTDEYAIVYLARQLTQHKAMPEETEQLYVRKVSFVKAYEMVEKGEITDAISVAAFLKIKLLLLENKLNA
jgi:8-oxo-dGTP pyrophosphatase MutT (NUDIX family)